MNCPEDERRLADLERQTLYGACRELREAWLELVLTLAYSLGIHHVCSRLTHTIEWCKRRLQRVDP